MIILLSPTKQMDFSSEDIYKSPEHLPRFTEESKSLNEELKKLSIAELVNLMKVSEKIAIKTAEEIAFFQTGIHCKSALAAYSGTMYQWLNVHDLNSDDLLYARKNLRIMSGLYGLLRPDDLISPYRLEMKTPLCSRDGENLYQFWKNRITDALQEMKGPFISLASNEYLKVIDKTLLGHPLINLVFKEKKNSTLRTVGMYAKQARGQMARKIIRNRLVDPEDMKLWDIGGYKYDEHHSSDSEWVFTREERD